MQRPTWAAGRGSARPGWPSASTANMLPPPTPVAAAWSRDRHMRCYVQQGGGGRGGSNLVLWALDCGLSWHSWERNRLLAHEGGGRCTAAPSHPLSPPPLPPFHPTWVYSRWSSRGMVGSDCSTASSDCPLSAGSRSTTVRTHLRRREPHNGLWWRVLRGHQQHEQG